MLPILYVVFVGQKAYGPYSMVYWLLPSSKIITCYFSLSPFRPAGRLLKETEGKRREERAAKKVSFPASAEPASERG